MIILTLPLLQMSSTFTYLSQQHLLYLSFCLLLSTAVTSDSSCPTTQPSYCKLLNLTTLLYTFKEPVPDLSTPALNSENLPGKPVDIRWSRVDYQDKSACAPAFNLTWRLPNPGNFTAGFRLNFTYVFGISTPSSKSHILEFRNPAGIADYSRVIFYYDCLFVDDTAHYLFDLRSLSPKALSSSSCRANHNFLSFSFPIRAGSVECSWVTRNSSDSLKPLSCTKNGDSVHCSGHWKAYATVFSAGSCIDVILEPGPECLQFISHRISLNKAQLPQDEITSRTFRTVDINNTIHCQFRDVLDGSYFVMIDATSKLDYQCLLDGQYSKCDVTVLGPLAVSAGANCEKCRLMTSSVTNIMSTTDQEISSETMSMSATEPLAGSESLSPTSIRPPVPPVVHYFIIYLAVSISVIVLTITLAVRRCYIKQPASQVLVRRRPKILLATFMSCENFYEIINPFEELLKRYFDCSVVRGNAVDETVDHAILIPPESTTMLNIGGQPNSLRSELPVDIIFYRFLADSDLNAPYQLHIVSFECSQSHSLNQPLAYWQQRGRLPVYILLKDIHRLLIDIFGHETVSSVDYWNCYEHQQLFHALQCKHVQDSGCYSYDDYSGIFGFDVCDVCSVQTDEINLALEEMNIDYDRSCRTAS